MCYEMSTGVQKNEPQQYDGLEDASLKLVSTASLPSFMTATSDWTWDDHIKPEITSPKDSCYSDDSDSQQTLYNGFGNDANAENMPDSDLSFSLNSTSDDMSVRKKKKCKDSSSGNKPAQVVERRNARERRRVQAVNGAFQKLRKVVPIEENKSKRMSKVKTLQLAIEYINQLQNQLQFNAQHSNEADLLVELFQDYQQQLPSVKSENNEFSFRVPNSYYLNDTEN